MRLIIRSDSVTLEGYVNAVERNSKPLTERGVTFIERVSAGAFKRALKRAQDVRILLNHRKDRDLGGIADGNLELEEDNIGLKARATITDPEVVEDAKRGDLVGWSFGFSDVPEGVKQLRDEETGLPLRKVNELDLFEVSILNRKRSPAYVGTLVNVRDDGQEERVNISDDYEDELETINEVDNEIPDATENENTEETRASDEPAKDEPAKKELTSDLLASYKNIIHELKETQKTTRR